MDYWFIFSIIHWTEVKIILCWIIVLCVAVFLWATCWSSLPAGHSSPGRLPGSWLCLRLDRAARLWAAGELHSADEHSSGTAGCFAHIVYCTPPAERKRNNVYEYTNSSLTTAFIAALAWNLVLQLADQILQLFLKSYYSFSLLYIMYILLTVMTYCLWSQDLTTALSQNSRCKCFAQQGAHTSPFPSPYSPAAKHRFTLYYMMKPNSIPTNLITDLLQ